MGEMPDAPKAMNVVFSELDAFDVTLRSMLARVHASRREAGLKPINMNGLIKKLLYDWLVQYLLTGSMDQPPIWMQAGAVQTPRQVETAITANDDLAMAFMDSNYDD